MAAPSANLRDVDTWTTALDTAIEVTKAFPVVQYYVYDDIASTEDKLANGQAVFQDSADKVREDVLPRWNNEGQSGIKESAVNLGTVWAALCAGKTNSVLNGLGEQHFKILEREINRLIAGVSVTSPFVGDKKDFQRYFFWFLALLQTKKKSDSKGMKAIANILQKAQEIVDSGIAPPATPSHPLVPPTTPSHPLAPPTTTANHPLDVIHAIQLDAIAGWTVAAQLSHDLKLVAETVDEKLSDATQEISTLKSSSSAPSKPIAILPEDQTKIDQFNTRTVAEFRKAFSNGVAEAITTKEQLDKLPGGLRGAQDALAFQQAITDIERDGKRPFSQNSALTKAAIEALLSALDSEVQKNKAHEKTIQSKQQALEALTKSKQAVDDALLQARADLTTATANLTSQTDRADDLDKKLTSAKNALAAQLAAASVSAGGSSSAAASLQSLLAAEQQKVSNLETQKNQLTTEVHKLTPRIGKLEIERDAARAELDRFQKNEYANIEQELKDYRDNKYPTLESKYDALVLKQHALSASSSSSSAPPPNPSAKLKLTVLHPAPIKTQAEKQQELKKLREDIANLYAKKSP